jgi:TRAP-type transport system periplasmic protein
MTRFALLVAAGMLVAVAPPVHAQTTSLTMSSWVSPQHHLTSVVLQGWANEVEKATSGWGKGNRGLKCSYE